MGEQKIEPGQQAPAQVPPPTQQQPGQQAVPAQKPPEPVPGAGQPKEGQPPAPEDFALAIPEGVEIDKEVVEGYKAAWKKGPQAVLDFYLGVQRTALENFTKAQAGAAQQREADNLKALKADPDFGKDFEANKVIAQRPLAKYADPATAKYLTERGLMNDPVLTKFLHKIGKEMGEDTTPAPAVKPPSVSNEPDLQSRYDKSPDLFRAGG